MRTLALILIRFYQWCIRPLTGPSCRFHPSCSCYAHTAITRFGAWHGGKLMFKRLSKCHPWNDGGYDPVPASLSASANDHTSTDKTGHTLHG